MCVCVCVCPCACALSLCLCGLKRGRGCIRIPRTQDSSSAVCVRGSFAEAEAEADDGIGSRQENAKRKLTRPQSMEVGDIARINGLDGLVVEIEQRFLLSERHRCGCVESREETGLNSRSRGGNGCTLASRPFLCLCCYQAIAYFGMATGRAGSWRGPRWARQGEAWRDETRCDVTRRRRRREARVKRMTGSVGSG